MNERIMSAIGACVMMFLAWAMCPAKHRKNIQARTVGWGVVLLLVFAVVVLKTPVRDVFMWANGFVEGLLGFSKKGAQFLFGDLANEQKAAGFVFAFQILPTIVFFAALMSLLYHIRVMPFIIRHLGRFIARFLGTSGAESFSTVADIFVGPTEAPLAIRPYLSSLTKSEINACMVAGFATTSGGVLAAYVGMLHNHIPDIAGHLIACSVMCAPASLVIAKLMLPETEPSTTSHKHDLEVPSSSANLVDAVVVGTGDGLRLAVNVGAMLISFLAITALVNFLLQWVGAHIGFPLSLEILFGWLFAPLAWVMGVPSHEVLKVASLLGQKTVLNEFVAYAQLAQNMAADGAWLSERSRLLASYALCGFANFGAIGIQIGGYAGLAPERRQDLSALAFKAMLGGLLTTCLVACVAGALV
jgi:CNT family concentrative nucleoside transporter